ncbi:Inositol 2-dehydrogenase [Planctomycetes bacterium Pan216]|uniref:Inositol 2-dehydrogenase n=1 Tax=Kolteria novifilia TaxID=2527975 RepID=A0A518BBE4_9BACT|nr:Inositol 2-dehydrogenase [Planctomycetes bacterium Pan216]
MPERNEQDRSRHSRRGFVRRSAAAVGAGLALGSQVVPNVHAAGSQTLKIGLVGCGGRGRGAAVQALKADPQTRLVALADAFPDQIETTHSLFGRMKEIAPRAEVPKDRCYTGFDAYQQLIDSDVDVVLLAAPPHFRPKHMQACVEAGKHVFAEKPVAVDAAGVKGILEAGKVAKEKDLVVVSGLCWRYDNRARAAIEKIHNGDLGHVVAIHSVYNASPPGKPWPMRQDASWGPMEEQLRNWYWFTWLSGDHIVEQAIHSIDKGAWAIRDETPLAAVGLGGLQARQGDELGSIFDHHTVVYEHENGLKHFHTCRQQIGCTNDVGTEVVGTNGICDIDRGVIRNHDGEIVWKFKGKRNVMHQQEQDDLIAAIRAGKPINNTEYMAKSTMQAILGRMASYTGKRITWDQAMNSKEEYALPRYDWKITPETRPIAVPGTTRFV